MSELTIIERAQKALSVDYTEAELKDMAEKYADVTEIKDTADYQLVKSGGILLGKTRVSIEKAGKAARDDANKFRTAVIAEERRLTGIIVPEETRLKALRKEVDDKEAREAEAARQIEQQRISDIMDRMQSIKDQTNGLLGVDATSLQMRLNTVNTILCNEILFAEYADQAVKIKAAVIETICHAIKERQTFEDQQAKAEQIRIEQDEQQAKLDKQAEENQRRQSEIDAKERAEFERIRKENEKLEQESREREHAEKLKVEQEAETARQEALRPEKDRLIDWLKKLRFIDGIELHNEKLVAIQGQALKGIDVISKQSVKLVENT